MGGTVDPKTGQIIWDMHVALPEQLAHYRAHPPRAIRPLRATPIEVDWKFDGHGEPVQIAFELACPCGGTRFYATSGLDEGEHYSPATIECETCSAEHVVFDADVHGYDAETAVVEPDDRFVPEELGDLISPDFHAPYEIIVGFEYPSDVLGDPEWRGREHDLFSWFTVLARDPLTKRLAYLFDAECA